jgi:hypothetical protein
MGRNSTRGGAVILATVCAAATLAPGTPATAAVTTAAAGSAAVTTAAAGSAAAPVIFGAARQIVLVRAGGIAGTQDTFVVKRDTPGGQRALRLAGSWRFRWLRGTYQPKNPCCDRFTYRLTVTYRGGHRKTVATVQGAEAPKILWDVIAATEKAGQPAQ